MPGLMDMFAPQDPLGQPRDFGNAITSHSNSLIGLGMGMLQPYDIIRGQSPWSNALQGWQGGAAQDIAQARTQQQMRQQAEEMAFRRSQAALAQSNWERQFARGDVTDAQRAWNDKVAADPSLADNREAKIKHFGEW